jgi:hypothetical protein
MFAVSGADLSKAAAPDLVVAHSHETCLWLDFDYELLRVCEIAGGLDPLQTGVGYDHVVRQHSAAFVEKVEGEGLTQGAPKSPISLKASLTDICPGPAQK